jgi:FkbM family methyltransferase
VAGQANRYGWLARVRPAVLAEALKTLLRVPRIDVRTPCGLFSVDPTSRLGVALLRDRRYESPMEAQLRAHLRPGGVFVDVGANVGYFTVLASSLVGDSGRVFAIEPQDRLLPVLETNLRLNACRNVTVIHAATGAEPGEIDLFLAPAINSGSTSVVRMTRYLNPRQRAQRLTLTAIFERYSLPACDLVKVDVEGSEGLTIAGARDLLTQRRIGALAVEYHPRHLARLGTSQEEIHRVLLAHSYVQVEGAPTTLYRPAHRRRESTQGAECAHS